MLTLLFLLQAAAQPDIELNIRARAKSVEIERKGKAKLEVRGGEGSRVEARVEPRVEGRTKLRNVEVDIHAEASVADPQQIRVEAETAAPQ